MNKEKELPKRKPTRLKNFDYSKTGAYFVTICAKDRKQILSEIIRTSPKPIGERLAPPEHHINAESNETVLKSVGEGLAPPEHHINTESNETVLKPVGEGLAPPEYQIKLKPCGEAVKENIRNIEKRFPTVTVKDYIIMPDHIHIIIFLNKKTGGASPSPTLNDIICAFKSLTARFCKQRYGISEMFQRSFSEHIIRDREDYETRRKYINENPKRWYYKNMQVKE